MSNLEIDTKKKMYENMKFDDDKKSKTILYLSIILAVCIIAFIPITILIIINVNKNIVISIFFITVFIICCYLIYQSYFSH